MIAAMSAYDIRFLKAAALAIVLFLFCVLTALSLIWREVYLLRRAARYAAVKHHRASKSEKKLPVEETPE